MQWVARKWLSTSNLQIGFGVGWRVRAWSHMIWMCWDKVPNPGYHETSTVWESTQHPISTLHVLVSFVVRRSVTIRVGSHDLRLPLCPGWYPMDLSHFISRAKGVETSNSRHNHPVEPILAIWHRGTVSRTHSRGCRRGTSLQHAMSSSEDLEVTSFSGKRCHRILCNLVLCSVLSGGCWFMMKF